MLVKAYSCVASNHVAISTANMAAGSSSVLVLHQVFIAKLMQAILKVAPEILVRRVQKNLSTQRKERLLARSLRSAGMRHAT
jgi:hypothetical protein